MEALPPAGCDGRSLTLSSLLVVLLLASQALPSHSTNIGTSAAAAASSLHNHSHGLTSGGRIADDMGLEYLIDSLHIPARILAGDPYATYAANLASAPAACGRQPPKGKPYRCTPSSNPDPHAVHTPGTAISNEDPSIMRVRAISGLVGDAATILVGSMNLPVPCKSGSYNSTCTLMGATEDEDPRHHAHSGGLRDDESSCDMQVRII